MIRCRDGERVQMIARANGVDGNGILYVGSTFGRGETSSRTIRGRLKEFARCASNRQATGHIAGWNYSNRGYCRRFSFEELEYTCIVTTSKRQTVNTEAALIRAYRDQFLDLPPLNFNVPRVIKIEAGRTDEPSELGLELDDTASSTDDPPSADSVSRADAETVSGPDASADAAEVDENTAAPLDLKRDASADEGRQPRPDALDVMEEAFGDEPSD